MTSTDDPIPAAIRWLVLCAAAEGCDAFSLPDIVAPPDATSNPAASDAASLDVGLVDARAPEAPDAAPSSLPEAAYPPDVADDTVGIVGDAVDRDVARDSGSTADATTADATIADATIADATIADATAESEPPPGVVPIASGQYAPFAIAAAGPNVYWTTQSLAEGAVWSCGIDRCPAPRKMAAGDIPSFLATDATNVYWTNSRAASIDTCPLAGCDDGGATTVYAQLSPSSQPLGIAVDGSNVYWSDAFASAIYRLPLGSPAMPIAIATQQAQPWALVVYAGYVYWIDQGTKTDAAEGAVMRCATAGCSAPTPIASGRVNPYALAVGPTGVFWAEQGNSKTMNGMNGAILTCPLSGCPTRPDGRSNPAIVATASKPCGVALDDRDVYWTDSDDGTVSRCSLAHCSQPTQLANFYGGACGIALDATAVYWVSSTQGVVVKMPK
jgi:hypothetical protein